MDRVQCRDAAEREGVMEREMSAERLAEVRGRAQAGLQDGSILDRRELVDHVDAITAQRDEAREKLRALVEAFWADEKAGKEGSLTRRGNTAFTLMCALSDAEGLLRASVADPSARREGE